MNGPFFAFLVAMVQYQNEFMNSKNEREEVKGDPHIFLVAKSEFD